MKKQTLSIAHIGLFSVLFYILFLSFFREDLVNHHYQSFESDYDLMEVSYDMVISLGERLQGLVDTEFDGNNVLLLKDNTNSYEQFLASNPKYNNFVFSGEHVDLSELSVNIFPYFIDFTQNLNSANKDAVLFYLNFKNIDLILTSKETPNYSYNQEFNSNCQKNNTCTFYSHEKRVVVSKVYHDKITDNKAVTLSYPVYSHDGDVIFDVAVDLRLPWLRSNDNAELRMGEQSILFINGDPNLTEFTASKLVTLGSSEHFIIFYRIEELVIDYIYVLLGFFLLSIFFYNIFYFYVGLHRKSSKAEHTALHDDLTGLYNRRIFKHDSFKNAIADGGSVIYIDVNKFKPINDTFGHAVGDGVLKFVASHLRHQVRDSDFCVRFGGDEFVIVLPGCDAHKLQQIANNILAIKQTPFSPPVGAIHLSVGSEEFKDADSFKAAMNSADERMYEHKNSNRSEHLSKVIDIKRNTN